MKMKYSWILVMLFGWSRSDWFVGTSVPASKMNLNCEFNYENHKIVKMYFGFRCACQQCISTYILYQFSSVRPMYVVCVCVSFDCCFRYIIIIQRR